MLHTRKVKFTRRFMFVVLAMIMALPINSAANPYTAIGNSASNAVGSVPTQALPDRVASGDTTQSSTVLWARSNATGTVTFVVMSAGPVLKPITRVASAVVTDISVPAKVEIIDLEPATEYVYRVMA